MEKSPLLGGAGRGWRRGTRTLVAVAVAVVSLVALVSLGGLGNAGVLPDALVQRGGGATRPSLLYQDWRGVSLEQRDSYSFTHTWKGDMNIGHTEQHVVKPANLVVETPSPAAASNTAASGKQGAPASGTGGAAGAAGAAGEDARAKVLRVYLVALGGKWDEHEAQGLLEAFETVCGKVPAEAAKDCGLTHSTWTVSEAMIPDDVVVAPGGSKVTVSRLALVNALPRKASYDGVQGTVRSKRMQHGVMRVVTDWGHKPEVADKILNRMFGATLDVSGVGMTKLTEATTIEDGERFMKFKPRELMLMLEAWSDMPQHMHKVDGLRYVTRRQQGINHPLYGRTTAVSWPTNLDQSYQEYMDYSFNDDSYTARHLFIHEKTHFFWGRQWDDKLKHRWEKLSGWEREEDTAHGWLTKRATPFVSGYGSRNSPDEDMAESTAAYVLHPNLLQARSQSKYKFFVDAMMHGVRYLEKPDVSFKVEDKESSYRLPATVRDVRISVVGGPKEDKAVAVSMVMDPGEGWHSPQHVEVSLSGPESGYHTLKLSPKAGWTPPKGQERTVLFEAKDTMSRYYENGFWSAKQIKVTDDLSNTRWIMVDQYSWRLYLNNALGTHWAPRYLPQTLALNLSSEVDPATQAVTPVFRASARFQQTGAPLEGTVGKDTPKTPIWMRLAAHESESGTSGGVTAAEWAENGAGGSTYPVYGEGTCVKDTAWATDGTCTVEFRLAPSYPAGQYYVTMLSFGDVAGNERWQFFTQQPEGVVCCGRVGNQGDDEEPTFVRLPECAKGAKPTVAKPCVVPDVDDPELDVASVRASLVAPPATAPAAGAGKQPLLGQAVVKFRARDPGGSGVGNIVYRVMDPQGYSHQGYVTHDNSATTVFKGDPKAWSDYEARLDLPKGSPEGEWKVESIQLHDKAGNRRNFQLIELLVFEPAKAA